ncbi:MULTISPECIES: hypothetical protein [unclassified Lysobacter]|uniref:hypothetical protein n=1 Tax=unclassified Lysobacter TaxID=2635362 RepID=UPI000A6168EA|nr:MULTISPECIES: hypothetical protein [unclassified Lysobacter]
MIIRQHAGKQRRLTSAAPSRNLPEADRPPVRGNIGHRAGNVPPAPQNLEPPLKQLLKL